MIGFPEADPRERWTAKDKAWEKTLKARYEPIRSRLLSLPPRRASRLIGLLLLDHSDRKGNPDLWTEAKEHDAVREAALVFTVLDLVGNLDFSTEDYWTAILADKAALVVLDGGGGESRNNCLNLAGKYCTMYDCTFAASGRPILIVAARSSGRVDPIVAPFEPLDITRTNPAGPLQEMRAYAERRRVAIFLCRDDLFDQARISDSPEQFLKKNLEKVLG